jgi:methylglutaconyl-CoA hydratase
MTISVSITHGIARVTLNRPEVHNGLNAAMIADLKAAFDRLSEDAHVRVVVLTGEGKNFCAGADLNWMQEASQQGFEANQQDAHKLARMFYTIDSCPKPVVALVNGAALGGGVGLVACCDIVVAQANAQFGLTEVRIGLIPATISPYVTRKIGEAQVRRYMLTGERFDAETARRIGLVHEIGDDADNLISNLLANGPDAMADTKALIREVAHAPVDEALLAMTAERIAARRASSEGREGIAAFLEKRKPRWTQ